MEVDDTQRKWKIERMKEALWLNTVTSPSKKCNSINALGYLT